MSLMIHPPHVMNSPQQNNRFISRNFLMMLLAFGLRSMDDNSMMTILWIGNMEKR